MHGSRVCVIVSPNGASRPIDRLAMGNPGDWKSADAPVSELRIDHGPGYRVYYVQRGTVLVVLLCGGDKSSQDADIRAAHKMLGHLDWE